MKYYITTKEIRSTHKRVFSCPACSLHYLLIGVNPYAYNSGVYGWNYDVYSIGSTAIITGYRTTGGRKIPHELIAEYENKARKIASYKHWKHETRKAKINDLLDDFITRLETL